MVGEKGTDSKMKETGSKKNEKKKEKPTGSDKMELNEVNEVEGKVETQKGNDKAENGSEAVEKAQKETDKMEMNEEASSDVKKEKEAPKPKKEDEKEKSGPSKRGNKEATVPAGRSKINVIDSKVKGGRGLTEWEASNLHLELKGEKGRLRPCERKNPRRKTYILRKNEVIIGRADDCDIKFQDVKGMGDKHCKITFTADGRAPEKVSNGKTSDSKTVQGNSSGVKQSGKNCAQKKPSQKKKSGGKKSEGGKSVSENSSDKPSASGDIFMGKTAEEILKRFPDINNTRKQIAEIMQLLDETQNCAEDLEQTLKECNVPKITELYTVDSDDEIDELLSGDNIHVTSMLLGDDPGSETWEKFLEKEISAALRQSSNRLVQTGKKIKIYKKRDANGEVATTDSGERVSEIDSDESSEDDEDDEDNEMDEAASVQEEASSIYLELLQCLRNYYRNKRSLSRISTLMFYLDAVYKNMNSFNKIRCPSWIRRTHDHREIVQSAQDCKESLKRMYRKFKEDRHRIEREPFGQLDPVRTLQSAQEFEEETPRRKLVARRKRCDKTTAAANDM